MCRNFLSQRVNSGGRHVRQAQLRSVLFVHAAKRGAISAAGWPVCSAALYRSRHAVAATSSQSCAPPTKSALRSQTEKRKAQRRAPSSAPCRWSCWSGRGRRRRCCSSACSLRRSRRCWWRAPRAAARRCRRRRCGRAPPSARPQWRRSRPAPPWRSPAPAWSARRRAGGQRGRASRRTAGTGGARRDGGGAHHAEVHHDQHHEQREDSSAGELVVPRAGRRAKVRRGRRRRARRSRRRCGLGRRADRDRAHGQEERDGADVCPPAERCSWRLVGALPWASCWCRRKGVGYAGLCGLAGRQSRKPYLGGNSSRTPTRTLRGRR